MIPHVPAASIIFNGCTYFGLKPNSLGTKRLKSVIHLPKMAATTPEEVKFAANVGVMIDAVHDSVTRVYNAGVITTINPDSIRFIAGIILKFDKHELIQGFINKSHGECWDRIRVRDEQFFLENVGSIFQFLPADKVNLFRDLYLAKDAAGKNVVPDSLKEDLWGLFDAMIKNSIRYIHNGRGPVATSTATGIVNGYRATFFKEVDVQRHAATWQVRLIFPAQC